MPPAKIERVAVIGAGAAGLAAVDYLISEGISVLLFERRSTPAGVWNAESGLIVKEWNDPVYDALQTNVPRTMMTLSDHKWENATSIFPPHADVKKYLQTYAEVLQQSPRGKKLLHCLYNTEVESLFKRTGKGGKKWEIRSKGKSRTFQAQTEPRKTEHFDAVVICTGNYDKPFVPSEEPGRHEWFTAYPGSLLAAHHFKNPSAFTDKVVVIVGNGPSGWDISVQLKGIAKQIIMSLHRPQPVSDGVHRTVGLIESYHPSARGIQFQDNVCIPGIDHVIYCTGYEYSFPFFKKGPQSDENIIPSGKKIDNLYEHMFYVPEPTIAFVGLPKMAAAFTIAEAQSAFVARIFSGRLKLPTRKEMQEAVEQQLEACQTGRMDVMSCTTYHTLAPSLDKEYINHLANSSADVRPLPDGTMGKPPPYWCKCFDNARAQLRSLRDDHKARGELRHAFNTYESLGHDLAVPCMGKDRGNIIKGCKSCYIP